MNSSLYLVVLCVACSIGFSNGLKCFNCDSHNTAECLKLDGNTTELVPEECTYELALNGPLAGYQFGVTSHYKGAQFDGLKGDFVCIKMQRTVRRTVYENETSQVMERNVYLTRACLIKTESDHCDTIKTMAAAKSTEEIIFCGNCDTDGCNFATPSTIAWPLMSILAVLFVVVKSIV